MTKNSQVKLLPLSCLGYQAFSRTKVNESVTTSNRIQWSSNLVTGVQPRWMELVLGPFGHDSQWSQCSFLRISQQPFISRHTNSFQPSILKPTHKQNNDSLIQYRSSKRKRQERQKYDEDCFCNQKCSSHFYWLNFFSGLNKKKRQNIPKNIVE